MTKLPKPLQILIPIAFLLVFTCKKATANIYAVNFAKVNYPAELQSQIDFVKDNVALYNHWAHDWRSAIPKSDAIKQLVLLYNGLNKIHNKTIETNLLMGEVAGFLYNMEVEEYYQKAIDNYAAAKVTAPSDYRVYWFLANHYALSNQQVKSIQTYKMALQYLGQNKAYPAFWSDYAVACLNANMLGTAKYAAHQASIIESDKLPIEDQVNKIIKNTLAIPPADTTIAAKNMWKADNLSPDTVEFTTYVLGAKLKVGSNWQISPGDYSNHTSYMTMTPDSIAAQNGGYISYSILMLVQTADSSQTLNGFIDKFTAKYNNRKPVNFIFNNKKACIAYEVIDKTTYTNMGGGHLYAIAIESYKPEFPGLALDAPTELPKPGSSNISYYTATQRYTRLSGKLYYLFLLDSCEDIHTQSLAVFKNFLSSVVIE